MSVGRGRRYLLLSKLSEQTSDENIVPGNVSAEPIRKLGARLICNDSVEVDDHRSCTVLLNLDDVYR